MATVAGPGGIGKTRIALQAAREALEHFPDGVWFVDLAPIVDPQLVAPTLASALGVREQAGRAALDAVCEHAREKRLLVLLDNCEHLLETCGEAAGRLLRACPHVRVLATSREELGVDGEVIWHAPPLGEGEAARLFVERARMARHGFAVTDKNAVTISELCRQLEGIPLAVELAAARVGILTPTQMLQRIGQRLDLLVTRHADVPSRHRTLRASIEWSYGLLSDGEQRAFAALSAFRGGWTLEAAEAALRNDECGMMNAELTKSTDAEDPPSDIHHSSFIIHHFPLLPGFIAGVPSAQSEQSFGS
jgi:predicted ATPase